MQAHWQHYSYYTRYRSFIKAFVLRSREEMVAAYFDPVLPNEPREVRRPARLRHRREQTAKPFLVYAEDRIR